MRRLERLTWAERRCLCDACTHCMQMRRLVSAIEMVLLECASVKTEVLVSECDAQDSKLPSESP
jgi:hypothetical protein